MIAVICCGRLIRNTASMAEALLDNHGRAHRYLRISLTDQCNFRCRYCMPEEGIAFEPGENLLTADEIVRLAGVFASLGIRKVRLTGGEPTLRRDLVEIARRISAVDEIETLAMTTNGSTLAKHCRTYREAGISILNVSLDSLDPEGFLRITRRNHLPLVQRGIAAALECGFTELKINCVVMKGINNHEILDFVELARELPLTIRFIEFMPFLGNRWSGAGLYPYAQIREDIEARYKLNRVSTEPSAVGKDFQIPGFAGRVGFVTSMTESFCGSCDRVRLTADGAIKPCLFSPSEVCLRDMMRRGACDQDLEAAIRDAVKRKPKEHLPMHQLPTVQRRSMIQIGG